MSGALGRVSASAGRGQVFFVRGWRTVTVGLIDAASGKRRMPAGVKSAVIIARVGEDAPADVITRGAAYFTSRTRMAVQFPADLPPGTKVSITACWANPREQRGPISNAVFVHLGYGVDRPTSLRRAA
jgi:hypothetical protein